MAAAATPISELSDGFLRPDLLENRFLFGSGPKFESNMELKLNSGGLTNLDFEMKMNVKRPRIDFDLENSTTATKLQNFDALHKFNLDFQMPNLAEWSQKLESKLESNLIRKLDSDKLKQKTPWDSVPPSLQNEFTLLEQKLKRSLETKLPLQDLTNQLTNSVVTGALSGSKLLTANSLLLSSDVQKKQDDEPIIDLTGFQFRTKPDKQASCELHTELEDEEFDDQEFDFDFLPVDHSFAIKAELDDLQDSMIEIAKNPIKDIKVIPSIFLVFTFCLQNVISVIFNDVRNQAAQFCQIMIQ